MRRQKTAFSAVVLAAGAAFALGMLVMGQPARLQSPPAQQPGEAAGPDGKGTPRDHTGTEHRGTTGWGGGTREQTKTDPGAGSRALSPEAQEKAADQPEMATGADLKGPPVRFPAIETPE